MFVVYSKESCGQCNMAKMLLERKNKEFTVKMLGVDYTREELQELAPGRTSMPIIFQDGKLIGGLMDLKALIN